MTVGGGADLRVVQRALGSYESRSLASGLKAVAVTYLYYLAAFVAATLLPWRPLRLVAALAVAVFMANLFLVGHDAGHGSYTGRRHWDQLIGRLAFLPLLHPFSAWTHLHNRVHHRYTNLRGKDFVWAPLAKEEYERLPTSGRLWYRIYHSTPGFGIYYIREIWWRRLFRKRKGDVPCKGAVYCCDRLLAGLGLALQLGACALLLDAARGHGAVSNPAVLSEALGTSIVLPFLVCTWMLGFGTYFNHTHPRVRWYADATEWSYLQAQLDASVHLSYPATLSLFLGNVMEHPAHHLAPRIPLAHLRGAQRDLTGYLGDAVVTQRWGWRAHREIVRTCKIYDFDERRWVGYDGRPHIPFDLVFSLGHAAQPDRLTPLPTG